MSVGIFIDNDFDKTNGVTTTLKAASCSKPRPVDCRSWSPMQAVLARTWSTARRGTSAVPAMRATSVVALRVSCAMPVVAPTWVGRRAGSLKTGRGSPR